MVRHILLAALACVSAASAAATQKKACANQPHPVRNIQPSVASGYTWAVVATGLTNPRSVRFDDSGDLWVLESGKGVTKFGVQDNGGTCLTLTNRTSVLSDSSLNHGMVIDSDKNRLIVSSADVAYQVTLDNALSKVISGSKKNLVTNMYNPDHDTRTLLLVKGKRDMLVINRGSDANMDSTAETLSSGHAQVKMFDITNGQSVDFTSHGVVLGWGTRNDVGLARHPSTNELWTVENSVDDLQRDGVDVHNTNPGEELNNLGVLDVARLTSRAAPKNYGYPDCFSAWNPSVLPNNANIHVGTAFASNSADDAKCKNRTAARLTFQAHTAPLDIKFDKGAKRAWVAFHGSWDAQPPVGYKVGYVEFNANGQPVAPSTSNTALHVVFANTDLSKCSSGGCFRPSGLVFDAEGRLWIASNDSGEIYVVAPVGTTKGY